jgi:molecular chaperone GrpE (heat shock protein)
MENESELKNEIVRLKERADRVDAILEAVKKRADNADGILAGMNAILKRLIGATDAHAAALERVGELLEGPAGSGSPPAPPAPPTPRKLH